MNRMFKTISLTIAGTALALTINVGPIFANSANSRITELADCASQTRVTTCYTQDGTLVRVAAAKGRRVQGGKITYNAGTYRQLDGSIVKIKEVK